MSDSDLKITTKLDLQESIMPSIDTVESKGLSLLSSSLKERVLQRLYATIDLFAPPQGFLAVPLEC